MKMTRRVLALLLALCLTFGNVMPAMATAIEGEEPAVTEEIVPVVSDVEETEAPAEETEAPVEETEAPVEETEAPVEETEAPVEETIAQIVDDAANASTTVTLSFASVANRTSQTTAQQVWEQNGIKLTNNKGSSTSNVADYSSPARFYKSSTLIIEYPGMTKIEFTANSSSYATSLKTSLAAAGFNATASSKVVTLTLDGVNEVSFVLTDGQVRMDSLTVYAEETSGPSCEHEWDDGVVTPPTCTADGYTTYTCDLCGDTKTGDVVSGGHTTDATGACTVCGDSTILTIAEAIELGLSSNSEVYTTIKYRLTGKITEVKNTTYGNVVITDGTDSILIYGMYSANGSTRYDKMTNKPVVGDTITVYGVIGNYNGTAQMKDSWLLEHTVAPCDHTAHGTDGKCSSCGVEVNHSFESNVCTSCGASEILTIAEAIDLGETKSSGSYTSDKYYVTGVITEVYNEQYGNMYITDGEGNTLTIYGTYSADGQTSYSNMEDKPVAGDMVKLYGIIGQFNGTAQMKNGWIIERIPAAPEVYAIYFDNSVAKWDAVILCIEHENGWCQIKGEKAEGDLFAFVFDEELLEYVAPSTITRIGFCEYAGGGYTSDTAFVNNKVYNDLTITNETITVYWDNSVMALDEVFVEISCEHGGEWGPMEGHMSAFYAAKNVDGDIYEYEIPACTAGYTIWFANEPYIAEDGKTYPEVPAPGSSEELAIDLTVDLRDDFSATVTIPANSTYYYQAMGIVGMMMSINDGEPVLIEGNPMLSRMPVLFTVTNETDEEADFVITVSHPVGSRMNPETIWGLGDVDTSLTEANLEGYYYSYTVDNEGTLIFKFAEDVTLGTADISVTNMNTYAQSRLLSDGVDGVLSLDVVAGDELVIQVIAVSEPVLNLTWNVNYPVGTELNPIMLDFVDYETGDMVAVEVTIPAETTYIYQAWNIGGMELSIDGEFYMLLPEVMGRMPVTFDLTNESAEEVTYTLSVAYPAGHMMNPASINMFVEGESWDETEGQNVATLEADNWNGYQYAWTADKDGELTLTFLNGKAGWAYTVNNYTAGIYGDMNHSYDKPAVNETTITVSAGDEIAIMVNTCGKDMFSTTPAGDVYFNAYFAPVMGAEDAPIDLTEDLLYEGDFSATVTIPAGKTYYFNVYRASGMTMSINGVEVGVCGGDMMFPHTWTITNEGAEAAVYTIELLTAKGTQSNPEELILENNHIAQIEAGNDQGFHFTWTAEDEGELIVYIENEIGWTYQINNLTARTYGDMQWSDSDPVEMPAYVPVSAGDEIQIIVNTYDPADEWNNPAGDICVYSEFEKTYGTAESPLPVYVDDDYYYDSQYLEPGQTYYYSVENAEGMMMYIWAENKYISATTNNKAEKFKATGEGDYYVDRQLADNCGVLTIAITNKGTTDAHFELNFYPVPGSENNPAVMKVGKNSVKIPANSDGYYFYFPTNETDGYLTITMSGSNWEYRLGQDVYVTDEEDNGEWVIEYGDLHTVADGKKSKTLLLENNSWGFMYVNTANGKSGTISFTASFNDISVDLLAGKNATLTFTNPADGKTFKAAEANWEIYDIIINGESIDAEAYANYASLVNGKVTTVAGLTDCVEVKAKATLKSDENIVNCYSITIRPAVDSIRVQQVAGYQWDEKIDDSVWSSEVINEDVEDLIYVVNGEQIWLDAIVGPDAAEQEVVWSSSNTKVLRVDTRMEKADAENGIYREYAYLAAGYSNGKPATGKANLIATATDGSGVKAVIPVQVVVNAWGVSVSAKNNQWSLSQGKSVTMTATLETWYENLVPTTKAVAWSLEMADGEPQWVADPEGNERNFIKDPNGNETNWIEYDEPIWVEDEEGGYYKWGEEVVGYWQTGNWVTNWIPAPSSVATLSSKGVLKAAAKLSDSAELRVCATVTNPDGSIVSGYTNFYVFPGKTSVEIGYMEDTYYLNDGNVIYPEAYAIYTDATTGDQMGSTDQVLWSSSNTKVAKVVNAHRDEEWGMWCDAEIQLVGTGKVTLTATALDGSKAKQSVTINVVAVPTEIELTGGEMIAAGASLTVKAAPYYEAYNPETYMSEPNYAVSNKAVTWSAKVVEEIEYFDDDGYYMGSEWVEVDNTIGLTCKDGTIKTDAKKVTKPVVVEITATAQLGRYDEWAEETYYASASHYVTVWPATTKVALESYGKTISGTVTIADDDIFILDAVGAPSGDYTWKSSNEKIATIEYNVDGSVTVVPTGKAGSAKITATANDGSKKSASITIKVVNPVKSVSIDVDHMLSVAKGKTVTLSKMVTMNPEKPTNNKLVWSMEWIENLEFDEDGNVASYAIKGDGKVDKKMATLNASSGALKCVNVSDYEYVRVTFTAADGYGASGEVFVILAPNAIKGVKLWVLDGEVYEDYTKKTYTCDESFIQLVPVATNAETDKCASGLTFEVSNKNFEAGWDTANRVIVVKPIEGAANPYGKVKVTVKTMDGGNVSSYVTINFVPGK